MSIMPEFEQNPYGIQDFHEAQLEHYGFKSESKPPKGDRVRSPSPQPAFQRNEATGMPVPRPKITRKPVPSSIQPLPPRAQSPPVSPRTQNAEGTRLIYTRADGRFDPSTIRTESSRYTPPASPVFPPTRPDSRSSNRAPLKRTNSNNSKSSWSSRRSNAGQAVRRFSNSLKEKADIVAMDRSERVNYIRNKEVATEPAESQMKTRPGRSGSITKGEKIALNISKVMDPMKARGRRGTDESSMSLGMTDRAPEGEMQACMRCRRPIFDFATRGLCQQCYKETKTAADEPWQSSQTRCTDPGSPEHGYMKLPSRKILRVRQTVYEDPGNPFAGEAESAEVGQESSTLYNRSFNPANDEWNQGQQNEETAVRRAQVSRKPVAGPRTIEPTRSANVCGSNSVTLPPSSYYKEGEEEYVAPRKFLTKDSPSMSDRDTRFYGFYDDIIRDYRGRESRKLE